VTIYKKAHPKKSNYNYGKDVEKVWEKYNNKCAHCFSDNSLQIHHIQYDAPKKNGERTKPSEKNNDIKNLILLCVKCHNKVHTLKYNNKWSRNYDCCIMCSSTTNTYVSNGICNICYFKLPENYIKRKLRNRAADRTEKRKEYKRKWYQEKKKKLAEKNGDK